MPRKKQPEMPEHQGEPTAPEELAVEEAPSDGDQAEAGADAEARAAGLGSPAEPSVDLRELSIEEVVRRLREQMADPGWHDHERALTLRLTVPEDPAGEAHLRLAFGPVSHPERVHRTWRRAQALVDASPVGRALGGQLELLPGGGRWHAWLHSPVLAGGFPAVAGGTRTPLGILRRVERAYRDAVVADGARALVARGRRMAAAEAAAQAKPSDAEEAK